VQETADPDSNPPDKRNKGIGKKVYLINAAQISKVKISHITWGNFTLFFLLCVFLLM